MRALQLLVTFMVFSVVKSKPTTESTHAILKRLGFDPVQNRSPVNQHIKRVAPQTNKARYHNDFNGFSNSDSRMFVVKLPPHTPYYSHARPEKFESQSPSNFKASFHTNGKPGQIYHWNIPLLKRLPHENRGGIIRSGNEDSRVYHVKILPNQFQPAKLARKNPQRKIIGQKNEFGDRSDGKSNGKYHRNKLFRYSDSLQAAATTSTNQSVVELDFPRGGSQIDSTKAVERQRGNHLKSDGFTGKRKNFTSSGGRKKIGEKQSNEVSKSKLKNSFPNYYAPAIPKQNSFYKYFSGNGKPKSFYVIEKSKKQTRLHRLL